MDDSSIFIVISYNCRRVLNFENSKDEVYGMTEPDLPLVFTPLNWTKRGKGYYFFDVNSL